jgi:hypothetical protein
MGPRVGAVTRLVAITLSPQRSQRARPEGSLRQEIEGAVPASLLEQERMLARGDQDYERSRTQAGKTGSRLKPCEVWPPGIDEHQIRMQSRRQPDRILATRGLAEVREPSRGVDHRTRSLPELCVVIDDDHTDRTNRRNRVPHDARQLAKRLRARAMTPRRMLTASASLRRHPDRQHAYLGTHKVVRRAPPHTEGVQVGPDVGRENHRTS